MRAGTEPPKHPALSIEIEHTTVAALRPEARRRDVSVARLVYNLLGTIVADGLVTAVLDDEPPSPHAPRSWASTLHQPAHVTPE
jgi:hypothetical protein